MINFDKMYNKKEISNHWFPNDWLKCTLPILEYPGLTFDNVQGSSFVIKFNDVDYIVTAKHVVKDLRDPIIRFYSDNRTLYNASSHKLNNIAGLKWGYHPDNLDLAVMPFAVPRNSKIMPISECYWNVNPDLKENSEILHLGFPHKEHADFTDGTSGFFPVMMPGIIIGKNGNNIITKNAALHGASGGPLFLKQGRTPFLIGVAIKSKVLLNGKYRYTTTSVPIANIIRILDSEQMKEQVNSLNSFLS